MKARVVEKTEAGVWLYLPKADEELYRAVQTAADACGAGTHLFGPESAEKTVAEILAGSPSPGAPDAENLSDIPQAPVLLMDGFGRRELDGFLSALRASCRDAGRETVELKAVVTLTNRRWTFSALAGEILQEHRLMHAEK